MRLTAILGKALLCTAVVCAAFGCGGGGGSTSAPDPRVRFINGSPDSVSVEYLLNDTVKATAMPYLTINPAFISTKPDLYDITVREVGAADPLDTLSTNLQSNQNALFVTVGLENFGVENLKRAQLVAINVDTHAPNGNKARLVIVHGYIRAVGFDTPAIDFQNPGDNPLNKVTNIPFANTNILTVDSGSQTFEARRTGTVDVLASATTNLDAGGIYVALVSGVEGQVGVEAPTMTFLKLN